MLFLDVYSSTTVIHLLNEYLPQGPNEVPSQKPCIMSSFYNTFEWVGTGYNTSHFCLQR